MTSGPRCSGECALLAQRGPGSGLARWRRAARARSRVRSGPARPAPRSLTQKFALNSEPVMLAQRAGRGGQRGAAAEKDSGWRRRRRRTAGGIAPGAPTVRAKVRRNFGVPLSLREAAPGPKPRPIAPAPRPARAAHLQRGQPAPALGCGCSGSSEGDGQSEPHPERRLND